MAARCILASGLKLNVSTSIVDDEGVDLVFHRRKRSTTLAVQVKSRMMRAKTIERGRLQANVGASTFRPRSDLHMLFVPVDAEQGTFPFAWLVPSKDFARKTKVIGKNRRVFVASMNPDSGDRWSGYRWSASELPTRILAALDQLGKQSR